MDLIEFICKYWQIVSGLILVIVSYVDLKSQNKDQERRLSKMEKQVEDMNPIWSEIKERLASIEATLKFLTKDE